MKLRFSIEYHTQWGQELRLVGSIPELGGWDVGRAPRMHYIPGGRWVLEVEVTGKKAVPFAYKYCLLPGGDGVVWEGGDNRHIPAEFAGVTRAEVNDAWHPANAPENALCTAAFTRAILGGKRILRPPPLGAPGAGDTLCRFRIVAPRVPPGCVVVVVGGDPTLGSWNVDEAPALSEGRYPEWEGEVALSKLAAPVSYKYAVYDAVAHQVVHWESGENRTLVKISRGRGRSVLLQNDGFFRYPDGAWRGAGIAAPVFGLRSKQGLGVGEFADIKRLVDWACATGIKLIQLLPVNDTVASHTWVDSYPYAAVSVFALHPIYMRLEDMQVLDDETTRTLIEQHREKLNALPSVDYEAVMAIKSRYYKLAYDAGRDEFLKNPRFLAFFEANRNWLVPYAAFSCLRDRFNTSDYTQWPEYQNISANELAAFTAPVAAHYDDVAVHYFIQFHLHRQLLDAAQYARANGVALKGDIPIGVYRYSVDTWIDRRSFNLTAQAGAPPDDFSIDGQNWGFPTYNWDVMAADGFAWWRQRLSHLATYFDAFRIDHILGFFRIWEIPLEHVQGIMGHFSPAFSISREELTSRGIGFDRERFCRPYIRQHMLPHIFGDSAEQVTGTFLEMYRPGCFRLRPEFKTQRQVEQHLLADRAAHPEHAERNEAIKWGLFRLIADVIFLESPEGEGGVLYPRHSFHRTYAYAELDADVRRRLDELYIDHFYKRHESFWRDQALIRLPAIRKATDMLICGEDLGMVPDCVPGVMDELGILSLFIQRMPKDPRQTFSHPADCPYLSVCSPSTHDMSTIRGWWEEDFGQTQRFYNEILGRPGSAPVFAEPWICREIVLQHLYSPSMWAIFPLQDVLALDGKLRRKNPAEERINVPSNPRHYWRYRMHIALDDLVQSRELNVALRGLITASGRNTNA